MLTVLRRLFRRIDPLVLGCAVALSAFSVLLLMGIQQMGVIGRRTVIMQIIAAALGLLLLLGKKVLFKKLPSTFYYYAWLAVLLRLVLPLPGFMSLEGGREEAAPAGAASSRLIFPSRASMALR